MLANAFEKTSFEELLPMAREVRIHRVVLGPQDLAFAPFAVLDTIALDETTGRRRTFFLYCH